MKKKLLGLLVTVVLLPGCGKEPEITPGVEDMVEQVASDSSEVTETEEVESYFLTFKGTTIEGEPMTSECFADSKLTMLNVWATYCGPCLEEMPYLGEIADSYDATEFQIIGIVSDVMENADEKALEEAKDLIAQTGANYPHLLLGDSLYHNLLYSVSAVPTTFFVNREGEVLGYMVGAYAKEDWETVINEILAELE